MPSKQPAEILTIANHILGTGQLSLAKFLFITADESNQLHAHDVKSFFEFVFERIQLQRDLHFHTQTTIDTLDYSGTSLNSGSKIVFAAYGEKIRALATEPHERMKHLNGFNHCNVIFPGIVALQTNAFTNYENAKKEIDALQQQLSGISKQWMQKEGIANEIVMIVICDDAKFLGETLNNFLWVTFTRCNPSHDIYGIDAITENKHWGCAGPLVIDARIKPHHAPVLEKDPQVEKNIERIFNKGGSLYGVIK